MSVLEQRYELNYKPYGDKAILIEWPQRIDDEARCINSTLEKK